MVSPQTTQPGNSPHPRQGDDESVRITAAIRRRVLSEFFAAELPVQRAVTEAERIDRKNSDTGVKLYTQADLKVRSAAAIQQWIASQNAAYADDNREFVGQVAK